MFVRRNARYSTSFACAAASSKVINIAAIKSSGALSGACRSHEEIAEPKSRALPKTLDVSAIPSFSKLNFKLCLNTMALVAGALSLCSCLT